MVVQYGIMVVNTMILWWWPNDGLVIAQTRKIISTISTNDMQMQGEQVWVLWVSVL